MKKVTKTKVISEYEYDLSWTVKEHVCIDKFSNGEHLLEVRTNYVVRGECEFDYDDNGEPPTEINGEKVIYDGMNLLSEDLEPTPHWFGENYNVLIPSDIKDEEKISEIVLPLLNKINKKIMFEYKMNESNMENNFESFLEDNLQQIINFINEK